MIMKIPTQLVVHRVSAIISESKDFNHLLQKFIMIRSFCLFSIASFSIVVKSPAGIVVFRNQTGNQKFVRCEYCQKYPNIIKQFMPRGKLPMTTETGTRFRSRILEDHIQTDYHKASDSSVFRLLKLIVRFRERN